MFIVKHCLSMLVFSEGQNDLQKRIHDELDNGRQDQTQVGSTQNNILSKCFSLIK